MSTTGNSPGWGLAAAFLSAAALWRGTGLTPVWWLTWLAAWPVLAFGLRASPLAAGAAAFTAWAGGGLNLWHYYRATLGTPLPVVLVAVIVPAAAFAAAAVLMRALAGRGHHLLATLALPAGWTAFEHAVSRASPHGTFGSLAYTQMDCLPVVQVAALLGTSGITFLLLLVPSALAMATLPEATRARARIAWATAAVVALVLVYGEWRLLGEGPARPSVTVGLLATDRPEQPVSVETDEGRRVIAQYARASEGLATAEVIVLPETVLRVSDSDVAEVPGRFAGLAEGRGVVVLGADRLGAGGEANAALAFQPGRAQPTVYAKHHLLLPFEARFQPGTGLSVLDTRAGLLGLAICKDMDFPELGRAYAERGASLLLVPAWDFTSDGWLHSRMAVLRGVEGGFAVARAARGGRLTISDDRGRVLAEAASAEAPVASAVGPVRLGRAGTPYATLGDWFGWLSCGALALALGKARRWRQ